MKNRPKRECKELPGKNKMPLPNIYLSKGKYPQSGKELKVLVPYLR